jgi:hypothetical protein
MLVEMVALQYFVDFPIGEEGELHLSHNEAEDLMMEDIGLFEFDS